MKHCFLWETFLLQQNKLDPEFILGIDEVGRGCVAGPVVVGLTVWKKKTKDALVSEWMQTMDDSKKLTAKKRNQLFEIILKELNLNKVTSQNKIHEIHFPQQLVAPEIVSQYSPNEVMESNLNLDNVTNYELTHCELGMATAFEIDTFNIWNGVQLAANRGLFQLQQKNNSYFKNSVLFFDGKLALKVLPQFKKIPQIIVVDGDACLLSVATASVIAKVSRDNDMIEMSEKFPQYEFQNHKGYGTQKHMKNIQQYGILNEIHRRSFLKEKRIS